MEQFIESEGFHMFLHALDTGNRLERLKDGEIAKKRMKDFLSEEYRKKFYDNFRMTQECFADWMVFVRERIEGELTYHSYICTVLCIHILYSPQNAN
jgi:hypothetical protein